MRINHTWTKSKLPYRAFKWILRLFLRRIYSLVCS
nr:MAG TPA: hypothetical protein [Caudoviricetes sp.]